MYFLRLYIFFFFFFLPTSLFPYFLKEWLYVLAQRTFSYTFLPILWRSSPVVLPTFWKCFPLSQVELLDRVCYNGIICLLRWATITQTYLYLLFQISANYPPWAWLLSKFIFPFLWATVLSLNLVAEECFSMPYFWITWIRRWFFLSQLVLN